MSAGTLAASKDAGEAVETNVITRVPEIEAVPGAYAFAADPIGYGVMGAVLMSGDAWLRLDTLARDDREESE